MMNVSQECEYLISSNGLKSLFQPTDHNLSCSPPHLTPHLLPQVRNSVLTKTGPSSSEIPFTRYISELVSFRFMLFFNL